jgi:hypothetical protein
MLGGRRLAGGRGTLLGHRLIRSRRLILWLVGHSGGSSPKMRIQIIAATRVEARVASAPRPASKPDQTRRFMSGLSIIAFAFNQTR